MSVKKGAKRRPRPKDAPLPKNNGKHPGGRTPKYRGEMVHQAKVMARIGATEADIAEALRIDPLTLMRWKSEHPQFCRALTPGKAAADKRVEASLYHPDTHIAVVEGKIVKTEIIRHYPPAEGAMKLWLTNRQPRKWREIKSTTIMTPPGQPLEHKHTYGTPELLSDFYRRAGEEAAVVAGLEHAEGEVPADELSAGAEGVGEGDPGG
jgi:hypothetical protein